MKQSAEVTYVQEIGGTVVITCSFPDILPAGPIHFYTGALSSPITAANSSIHPYTSSSFGPMYFDALLLGEYILSTISS
jgi:hypothetical protein